MDKVLVALILGIITCIMIIFDIFDKFILLGIFLGIYELISNYIKYKKNFKLISFAIIILLIISYMIYSKEISINELLFVLMLVIISDVFQDIFGKIFGKNKIGWISPNKTYEGYIGGYVSILIIYFIMLHINKFKNKFNFINLNLIYIFGVFGDLFFSFIKRNLDIKDYSNILLSHGGVLDRLDSFIIALLVYGLFIKLK